MWNPNASLPYVTADLPGTGGSLKTELDDFVVEEIPAYEPCEAGEHLFLWIEKRGIAADRLLEHVARSLAIDVREVGCAGMKDTRAVTRQYLSVPARCVNQVARIDTPAIRVLSHTRHRNKLKTGHLRANRFRVRIRDAHGKVDLAQAVLEQLASSGFPNFFGAQRFGWEGSNISSGLALLKGRPCAALSEAPFHRRRLLRRLFYSAAQSALFNACLSRRMADGLLFEVVDGDVMQVRASGGPFVVEDVAREQQRFDAQEIVPTGPMFGPKMRAPRGWAAERELAILETAGLHPDNLVGHGKLLTGTRRPNLAWIDEPQVHTGDEGLEVSFVLPRGCYATVVLGEILKNVEPATLPAGVS